VAKPLTPMTRARRLAKMRYPGAEQDALLRHYRTTFVDGYQAGWNSRSKIAGKQRPGESYGDYIDRVSR
jgi:hypothetical protein